MNLRIEKLEDCASGGWQDANISFLEKLGHNGTMDEATTKRLFDIIENMKETNSKIYKVLTNISHKTV